MPVFSVNSEDHQRLDLQLLKNGVIHLYYRPATLSRDIDWLKSNQYRIEEFDCSKWSDEKVMHDELATRLEFPGYYGRNLDALNDCLRDLTFHETRGLVLVFRRYDLFTVKVGQSAWSVLDIIVSNSWLHLLFGNRFFALVQTDNPRLEFPLLGSRPALWNPREWLNSSRGI